MPFTNSNALGKLPIVTACGIGGAPLWRTSAIRGVPPLTALTQTLVHHRPLDRLAPSPYRLHHADRRASDRQCEGKICFVCLRFSLPCWRRARPKPIPALATP